jgi:8-oxo-dGTP diphosphatase
MNKLRLAGCVIYDNENKLLLIHRNAKRVQWELPGGKIDNDETPEEAAERELMEELGIKVKIVKKMGEKSFTEDQFEMDYTWLLATIESGEPTLMEKSFDDLRHFSWEELKDLPSLSANAKNLVAAYFNKELA